VIDDTDELRWLKDQQPHVDPPADEATGWARTSLLLHAQRSAELVSLDSRRKPESAASTARQKKGGAARHRRRLFAAAAAAIATAAAVAAIAIGVPHGGSDLLGPAPASAAVLTLAHAVQTAAPLSGDATLIQHTNALTAGPGSSTSGKFTGADLYLDDGRYYYAPTAAGLPEGVKAGPIDYSLKAVMDAMSGDGGADPQTARAAYLKAVNPLYGGDTEAEPAWQQDNVIWVSSIDLLGMAYGRPDVLARVLRVLSTVDGVTVEHTTLDGRSALAISMRDPGSKAMSKIIAASPAPQASADPSEGVLGAAARADLAQKETKGAAELKKHPIPPHLMTLTLDDKTGALLRYTDIGLVVTYKVSRVDAADYGVR
jgi:hypothetical protein